MALTGSSGIGVVAAIGSGLLYILAEVALGAVGEGIMYLLWHLLRGPLRPVPVHPVLSALGLGAIGAGAGWVSYVLHAERIITNSGPRGISLLVAPLLLGTAMEYLGRWQRGRGRPTPAIASFVGGAWCAFVMALTRYVLFF